MICLLAGLFHRSLLLQLSFVVDVVVVVDAVTGCHRDQKDIQLFEARPRESAFVHVPSYLPELLLLALSRECISNFEKNFLVVLFELKTDFVSPYRTYLRAQCSIYKT